MSTTRIRSGFAMVVAMIILAAVIMSLTIATSSVQGQRTLNQIDKRKLQSRDTANAMIEQIASTLQSLATNNITSLRANEATVLIDPQQVATLFGSGFALPQRGLKSSDPSQSRGGLRVGDSLVYWNLSPVRVYDRGISGMGKKITASDLNDAEAVKFLNNSNVDPNEPLTQTLVAVGTEGLAPSTNLLFELVVDCFILPSDHESLPGHNTNAANFDPYTAIGQVGHTQVRRMVRVSIKRLFEYVVFYNGTGPAGDLEICNGPPLFIGGAVHTNASLYLGGVSQPNALRTNYFDNANSGSGITIGSSAEPNVIEGVDGIFRLRKVANFHRSWYEDTFDFTSPKSLMPQDISQTFNGVSGDASFPGGVPVSFNGVRITSLQDSRTLDPAVKFSAVDPLAQYVRDASRGADILQIQTRIGGGLSTERPLEPFTIMSNPLGGDASAGVDTANWKLRTPALANDPPANEMIVYKTPTGNVDLDHLLRHTDYPSLVAVAPANRLWNRVTETDSTPGVGGAQPLEAINMQNNLLGAWGSITPAYSPPAPATLPGDDPLSGNSFAFDYFTNLSHAGMDTGLRPAFNAWIGNALGLTTPQTAAGLTILERGIRNYPHHRARLRTVVQAWATAENYNGSAMKDPALDDLISAFQNAVAADPLSPMTQDDWEDAGATQANGIILNPANWIGGLSGGGAAEIASRTDVFTALTAAMPFTMGTMVPNSYFTPTPTAEYPTLALIPTLTPVQVAQVTNLAMQGYCHAMRSHFVVYFGCDQTDFPRFNDITSQFFSMPVGATNPTQLCGRLTKTVSGRETGWTRLHRYLDGSQRIEVNVFVLNTGVTCGFIQTTALSQVWPWTIPNSATPMSSVFNGAIYIARTARLFRSAGGPFLTPAPGIPDDRATRPWLTLENAQCNGYWHPNAPLGFNPVASHSANGGDVQTLPLTFNPNVDALVTTTNYAAAFFGGVNQPANLPLMPGAVVGGNFSKPYTTWPVIGNNAVGTVNGVVAANATGRSLALPAQNLNTPINNAQAFVTYPGMPLRVRIENGSLIDWGGRIASTKAAAGNRRAGLSIFTPQIAYLKGNYNTLNPEPGSGTNGDLYPPCALFSDACVVLSDLWTDNLTNIGAGGMTNSGISGGLLNRGTYSTPIPSAVTTYRLSFVIHNVPTDRENSIGRNMLETSEGGSSQNGSGELENVLKYEENWGGRTFNFNGSLVVFGRARYTRWQNDGYFGAPTRNYGYNNDLYTQEGQPPFAPFSVIVDTW